MPTLPTAEKYALPSSLSMKGKRLEVCPIVGPLRIRLWEMCVHSGTLVGSPSLPTCMYAARFHVLIGPWSCVSLTQLKSRLFSIVWPWQNASFRLICQPHHSRCQ